MHQPYLQKGPDEQWRMVHPEYIEKFEDLFYEALDQMVAEPAKAERKLKKIIMLCRNGYLDAILHLGFLFNSRKKPVEGNALIEKAYRIAKEAIPAEFIIGYDQVRWSDLDNRPFLHSLAAYAEELMDGLDYSGAIKEFEYSLRINPGDNLRLRYHLLRCFQLLGSHQQVLDLENDYEGDYTVDFFYGKLIALWNLGRKSEAEEQLLNAKGAFPHVIAKLLKDEHEFPFDEFEHNYIFESSFPHGSRQEAYHYWSRNRNIINGSKGLVEFVMEKLTIE